MFQKCSNLCSISLRLQSVAWYGKTLFLGKKWWIRPGSNQGPGDYESPALTN